MDSSRSGADDWLVGREAAAANPEASRKPAPTPSDPTLAELSRRLDAIESGEFVRRQLDELRIEIRDWITDELNALADRLETPRAVAPTPPPTTEREREILDQTDFLPYADRVERQLAEIEDRVERAGRVVRDLSTGEPLIRATQAEPGTAARGREAEEAAVDETSGDVISRAVAALNKLTFEQLRELGLSVTQSARLLARRDARGSFASFDELNDLVGFSREVLDQLRKRLSLG